MIATTGAITVPNIGDGFFYSGHEILKWSSAQFLEGYL